MKIQLESILISIPKGLQIPHEVHIFYPAFLIVRPSILPLCQGRSLVPMAGKIRPRWVSLSTGVAALLNRQGKYRMFPAPEKAQVFHARWLRGGTYEMQF